MALKTIMKKSSSGSVSFSASTAAQNHLDQSAHRGSVATNQAQHRRRASMLSRNSSVLSSYSSNHSSDILPQIDEGTQSLVVEAANFRKDTFREKLPESLLSSHDGRDVIAPFLREEVSRCTRPSALSSLCKKCIYTLQPLTFVHVPSSSI